MSIQTRRNARGTSTYRGMPQQDRGGETRTDRRRKEEDDERVNWRLGEKMEKILKEKQETAETIEKEPDEVTIEQEPEEVKQEPEEDCRVGKRPMEQQEEGTERKRVQVSFKDALASGVKGGVQGGEKRGPQETKEVQGENKRPRENAPQEESAELPMDFSLIQQRVSVSVDVAELYSPPQVTAEAQKFGLKIGEAMDILTVWTSPRTSTSGWRRSTSTSINPGSPWTARCAPCLVPSRT